MSFKSNYGKQPVTPTQYQCETIEGLHPDDTCKSEPQCLEKAVGTVPENGDTRVCTACAKQMESEDFKIDYYAKRYFSMNDGIRYTVVARDTDHAEHILRDAGLEFGQLGQSYDEAKERGVVAWQEFSAERAALVKVHRNAGGPADPVPLTSCALGDWFSSEW